MELSNIISAGIIILLFSSLFSSPGAKFSSFEDSLIRVSYEFDKDPSIVGNYLAGDSGFIDIYVSAIGENKIRVTSYGIEFEWPSAGFYTRDLGEKPIEVEPQKIIHLGRIEFTVTTLVGDTNVKYHYKIFVNYEYWVQDFWHPFGAWISARRLESEYGDFYVRSREIGIQEMLKQLISATGSISNSLASVSGRVDRISSDLSSIIDEVQKLKITNENLSLRLNEILKELSTIKTNLTKHRDQISQFQKFITNQSFLVKLENYQLEQIINEIETNIYWNAVWIAITVSVPISIGITLLSIAIYVRFRKNQVRSSYRDRQNN